MPMYSACGSAALPALGFPIRESTDHRLFSVSPWLFAAVHALLRLLVPRHPPCALLILTVIRRTNAPALGGTTERPVIPVCWPAVQFSRSAEAPPRPHELPDDWSAPARSRSLKTQQHAGVLRRSLPIAGAGGRHHVKGPIDISVAGPPSAPADDGQSEGYRARGMRAPGRNRPLQSWSFPRKEVIQPHLPVRLPCYDFTPVTSPTFDGSLPKGLGHRLRVLLASVV